MYVFYFLHYDGIIRMEQDPNRIENRSRCHKVEDRNHDDAKLLPATKIGLDGISLRFAREAK